MRDDVVAHMVLAAADLAHGDRPFGRVRDDGQRARIEAQRGVRVFQIDLLGIVREVPIDVGQAGLHLRLDDVGADRLLQLPLPRLQFLQPASLRADIWHLRNVLHVQADPSEYHGAPRFGVRGQLEALVCAFDGGQHDAVVVHWTSHVGELGFDVLDRRRDARRCRIHRAGALPDVVLRSAQVADRRDLRGLRQALKAQRTRMPRGFVLEDSHGVESRGVLPRLGGIALGAALEAARALQRGFQPLLFLYQPAAYAGETPEFGILADLRRRGRKRRALDDAQGVDLLLPGRAVVERGQAHGLRFGEQRVGPAYAFAADCRGLGKPALNLADVGAHVFEFLLLRDVVVRDSAKEVGQGVLDRLRDEAIAGAVEQVAALRDLVLRLQAEGQGVADGGCQRSAGLARRWLMQVVGQPDPGGQQ